MGPKTLLAGRGASSHLGHRPELCQIIMGRHKGPQGVEIWKCFPEEEGVPVLEDTGTFSIKLVDCPACRTETRRAGHSDTIRYTPKSDLRLMRHGGI